MSLLIITLLSATKGLILRNYLSCVVVCSRRPKTKELFELLLFFLDFLFDLCIINCHHLATTSFFPHSHTSLTPPSPPLSLHPSPPLSLPPSHIIPPPMYHFIILSLPPSLSLSLSLTTPSLSLLLLSHLSLSHSALSLPLSHSSLMHYQLPPLC